ncbi:pilus assembly protein TadG-related protein [Pseudomonas sp. SDO528_S397]
MLRHGRGPNRQRGAIGLMSAMTLSLALLLLVLVVDTGRLHLEKRKLQRVADTAALETVSRGGKCTPPDNNAAQFARESAIRNDFTPNQDRSVATACGTLVSGADSIRRFSADPLKAEAIQVTAVHRVPTSIAAGVLALFSSGKIDLTTTLSATAVAALPPPPLASLTIRTTLLTVDSSKSQALNALIGGLLGGSLKISALGWQGLVNTEISLLSYLDALAVVLKLDAFTYDGLLKTDVSAGQLIEAAIKVLERSGALFTAQINNLKEIQLIAPGTKILNLKDLILIQNGTDKAALDVNLQLFNLIQGFVQLSNKNSAVEALLPINLLGLAKVTVRTKVIEPAQISAIGNPQLIDKKPIAVRTAQVRTLISVELPILDAVNGLVQTLTTVLNILGIQLSPSIGGSLDVALEAASGSSYVSDFRCNGADDTSLSVVGTTSAVRLMIGQIDPTHLFASNENELEVNEFPVLDLGIKQCSGFTCGPRQPYGLGGMGLKIDSPVAKTEQPYTFVTPPKINQPPAYYSFKASNVIGSLSNTLGGIQLINHPPAAGGLLGLLLGVVVNLVSGVLNTLSGLISGLLSPLLDPLVNGLLAGLGVDLAKVEIGANLSCNPGGRAMLVI